MVRYHTKMSTFRFASGPAVAADQLTRMHREHEPIVPPVSRLRSPASRLQPRKGEP